MINKVIYLFYTKVYDFEYEKYGLNLMKEKGMEVEAWSLEHIFFPNFKADRRDVIVNGMPTFYLNNYFKFVQKVFKQKRKKAIFILNMPVHNIKVNICEAIIKLLGFRYCMTYLQPVLNEGTMGRLKYSKLNKIWWEDFMDRLFQPEYNFVATKVNFLDYSSKDRIQKNNNIMIHTLDYDRFLKERNEPCIMEEDYILFLDEYEPFHSDGELLNLVNPNKNAERYYSQLNKLFSMLEKYTGYSVVIAEHPRADYSDKEHYLYGRRHFRNKTIVLVRDCKFAITHCSLAQDYIVLFDKPFIIICNNGIKNAPLWRYMILPYLKMFECESLNLDEIYDWKKVKETISYNKNNSYKKYIKSLGSENKLFFQIVYEYIMKI